MEVPNGFGRALARLEKFHIRKGVEIYYDLFIQHINQKSRIEPVLAPTLVSRVEGYQVVSDGHFLPKSADFACLVH
jgi:hypothetical protein